MSIMVAMAALWWFMVKFVGGGFIVVVGSV